MSPIRRVGVPERDTEAKDAPSWLNASTSYAPTGRNARNPPVGSVRSHRCPETLTKATVASGFSTAGVASFTVPVNPTPLTDIAWYAIVAPAVTGTGPGRAQSPVQPE